MADEIDLANTLAELELQSNLNKVSLMKGPVGTGYCLYCEDQLHSDMEVSHIEAGTFQGNIRRWCDADCRDWWQDENK